MPTPLAATRSLSPAILQALLICCGWLAGSAAQACSSDGDFDPPLRHDERLVEAYSPASGVTRTTLFQIPDSAPTSDRVMVILLHGGGDHYLEDMLSDMRDTGWTELAEREGIVLAYPTALKQPDDPFGTFNWNDGRLGTGVWSMPDEQDIDDVAYLAEVMDTAQRDYGVGERIYVMGISNGGLMAFRLASEAATNTRLRAMATVVAQIPRDRADKPLAAIPTMLISGTKDPIIPFQGGEILTRMETPDGIAIGDPVYLGEVTSYQATLSRLLAAHGCGTGKTVRWLPDRTGDGTQVVAYSYCGAAGTVQSIVVAGGGHRWQGVGDNSPANVHPCYSVQSGNIDFTYYLDAGLSTQDGFNATQAAWRFFQRY